MYRKSSLTPDRPISVEVVRLRKRSVKAEFSEAPAADTDHAVELLQHALDQQQGRALEQRAMAMEQVESDDRVAVMTGDITAVNLETLDFSALSKIRPV